MRQQLIRSTVLAVALAVLITMAPVVAAIWNSSVNGRGAISRWLDEGTPTSTSIRLFLIVVGLAVLALAAGVVVATQQARRLALPMTLLADRAERLGAGESRIQPLHSGIAELDQVSEVLARSAQRLTKSLASERDFAADASHQLRTPLTALRLRLENLEATMPPAAAGDLRAAAAETGRLARLVDGLLALAHAEAAPSRREVVDLAAVVADRQAAWAPLAAEQDVELTVQPGPTAPVWAVPGAVEQVLDNLLENALRFAPVGSSIELAVRQAEGWVELRVTDQGPGMPAEQRERAFDRFWRGPATDREGTGLGLAIVRQLLEASGGTAELHPNPDGGLDAVARLRPARHDTTARRDRHSGRQPEHTTH
jgi:signal transduction histidine kinase